MADNSEAIRDSILNAILKKLPDIEAEYDIDLPLIKNVEDFKNHIGLSIIHIMKSGKDNFVNVGYEFGCTWDEEHGLGIMTNNDKLIAIGDAETAFSSISKIDFENPNE